MATTPVTDAGDRPPAPTAARRNGMGTASLVLGVLALVLAILVIFSPLALPLGVIAVILGIIGMTRVGSGEADNRGSAVGGIVTGAVGIGIVIVLGLTFVSELVTHQQDLRRFGTCMSNADNDDDRGECIR